MKDILRIVLCMCMLAAPALAAAQVDNPPKKQEIKVNDLDVIYDDEEYKGVVSEPAEEEEEDDNLMYQVPFFRESIAEDGEEEPEPLTLTDDGAFTEDEILREGFDTALIHLPKFDVGSLVEPIMIELPQFSWPTPTTARPTSHYGPRRRRWHYGLDLAQPTGEPIYAAFDGVVRVSRRNKSYGNLVIIHHDNGLETYYAHMSKRQVVAGQTVKSGQQIGLCGNTGRSYGSHLHFEIRYRGNAINPEQVIDCSTHGLVSQTLTLDASSFRKVAARGTTRSGGSASGGWYRVRSGDTLEKIARRNGTTVKRLCQLNGIKETKILHPGDRLRVSGSAVAKSGNGGSSAKSAATAASSSASASYHTVRSGDTLSKIARRYGTTVKKLCQLNGISRNSTLRVGQKIRLK